jgi:hypothetical protein
MKNGRLFVEYETLTIGKDVMNGQDKRDLNVILERMEQADKDRDQMHTDIKFIKENMFNPHEGLWAESKENTRFRENTTKWRSVMGAGVFGLFAKHLYDMFA